VFSLFIPDVMDLRHLRRNKFMWAYCIWTWSQISFDCELGPAGCHISYQIFRSHMLHRSAFVLLTAAVHIPALCHISRMFRPVRQVTCLFVELILWSQQPLLGKQLFGGTWIWWVASQATISKQQFSLLKK